MASNAKDHLTYLALGDSYSIGEGVDHDVNWPNQLVNNLRRLDIKFDKPKVIAKTGWTTDELNAAITGAALKERFDLVSLSIGVNNQYRGRTIENFKKEFTNLLECAIGLAGGKSNNVFVLSIPDWGLSPFAKDRNSAKISKDIDAFNTVKNTVCIDSGVAFVDVTGISREVANNLSLYTPDQLHYTGEMYGKWTEKILECYFNR